MHYRVSDLLLYNVLFTHSNPYTFFSIYYYYIYSKVWSLRN